MLKFRYIGFDENMLDLILEEHKEKPVCFVFPASQNMKVAINKFQQTWEFTPHQFITLQDWKEQLFTAEYPLLKEEKRTLAFYLSLTNGMKDYFKINNYFQSIELGQNFFKFWEEINEELVTEEQIREVILERESSGEWQQNSYAAFLKIREDYKKYCVSKRFSDAIFVRREKDLELKKSQLPLVVVNQFYYTKLEKKLLNAIPNSMIYLQMEPECFDEKELAVSYEFGAEHLKTAMTKEIKVIQTTDQQSMILSLFGKIREYQPDAVIDFRFNDQTYSHFFSPHYFSRPTGQSLKNSRIYKILKHLHNILSKSINIKKQQLLPLEPVLHAFYDREFCEAVIPKMADFSIQKFLNSLAENDYQFIDLSGEFMAGRKLEEQVEFGIKSFLKLLEKYSQIFSMQQLSEIVATDVQAFCSKWELDYSDLPEQIFTALPDFQAPADAGIITDYSDLFSLGRNQAKAMAISSGIMKLFLDYLRFKEFSVTIARQEKERIRITSLVDSRNLLYHNPIILNVTEGILPQSRKTPFLLTENQRNQLGLKTYEDIRLRDKYYFYRMIAVSDNPTLYTIKNIEANVDVSSFLEELKLRCDIPITVQKEDTMPLTGVYESFLKNSEYKLPDREIVKNDVFYKFVCNPENDFPDSAIKLGFYQWENLILDPMQYYLKQVLKLREPMLEIRADFSEKFIGNLTHDIITLIWNRIIEVYEGDVIHHNFLFTNKTYVSDAVDHLLRHDKQLLFKSPHNYSWLYFSQVFLPILKEGVENFFYRLHNDLELSDVKLKVIPETREVFEKKLNQKDASLDIYLRMKADLRLETNNKKYIFDYKTGSPNSAKENRFKVQLQLYELLFYLIDNWNVMDEVSSSLFFVEAKQLYTVDYKRKPKEEVLESIKTITIEAVKHILDKGYTIPKKLTALEDVELTRRDLWRKL